VESKWRQNVFDFHMYNSDWRLASRLLEDTDYVLVGLNPFPNPDYQIWYHPDPDQLPTFVMEVHIGAGPPHFPYGNEVEPD